MHKLKADIFTDYIFPFYYNFDNLQENCSCAGNCLFDPQCHFIKGFNKCVQNKGFKQSKYITPLPKHAGYEYILSIWQ